MQKLLKDKKILAGIVIVVILIVGGVAAFAFVGRGDTGQNPQDGIVEEFPTLSPEDIGMEVTLRDDKKAVMFELTKADDVNRVEYEITYEKELEGEIVPEGIFGEMNIEEDGITKTDFREFGTCSSGVCRYDKVVSDITITLKVEKTDGKIYQVEKKVEL
ncbi:MAG: hypothetical protein HYV38_00180 [Candidatus Levybacteria bacterium]|nr:hypothetical protein [Candidatus Levybacteria bacterium]MBI2420489.1 hypothetical protein [Candidatus Levybacteria bacterium]MBI4097405.1 hypothetical protein [Candidatus Levybacteria bacterium]